MNGPVFELLRMLDDAGMNVYVPAEKICDKLELSRTTVWKIVNILRSYGYTIDASSKEGYALKKRSIYLFPYEIKRYLETKVIGKDMHHFSRVQSTNALARQMIKEVGDEVQPGTVLISEIQEKGYGRMNRPWSSPVGGIWATIFLKPKIEVNQSFIIMAAASIALAKTMKYECGLSAQINWPNDVSICDKKVAGTTLEFTTKNGIIDYCFLGVGVDANINVNKEFPESTEDITSLSDELGQDIDRSEFFARFLREFERRYQIILKGENSAILKEWKSLSNTLHRRVRIWNINEGFEGEAMDITENGALIVHRDDGDVEQVIAGDCEIIE